jgi:hypothetical protein
MSSRWIISTTTAALLLLSGCAATVSRTGGASAPLQVSPAAVAHLSLQVQPAPGMVPSGDWETLRNDWRETMGQSTGLAGMGYTWLEAGAEPVARPGVLAVVKVQNFRYVSAAARVGMGVLGGDAHINTEVSFYELPDKRLLGTRSYGTTTKFSEGIFSAASRKQVEAMSKEIVSDIKR